MGKMLFRMHEIFQLHCHLVKVNSKKCPTGPPFIPLDTLTHTESLCTLRMSHSLFLMYGLLRMNKWHTSAQSRETSNLFQPHFNVLSDAASPFPIWNLWWIMFPLWWEHTDLRVLLLKWTEVLVHYDYATFAPYPSWWNMEICADMLYKP